MCFTEPPPPPPPPSSSGSTATTLPLPPPPPSVLAAAAATGVKTLPSATLSAQVMRLSSFPPLSPAGERGLIGEEEEEEGFFFILTMARQLI